LPDHLHASLGDAYRLECELGGGGMARVSLADECFIARSADAKRRCEAFTP
jgi:hypothetical protein